MVKEAYGSQGKGVFLANNRAELAAIAERVKCKPHLFQRFVAESRGRDLRVIVLGGKVLGGMLRRAESEDFRSNVGAGGSGVAYEPSEEQATAAIKAPGRWGWTTAAWICCSAAVARLCAKSIPTRFSARSSARRG